MILRVKQSGTGSLNKSRKEIWNWGGGRQRAPLGLGILEYEASLSGDQLENHLFSCLLKLLPRQSLQLLGHPQKAQAVTQVCLVLRWCQENYPLSGKELGRGAQLGKKIEEHPRLGWTVLWLLHCRGLNGLGWVVKRLIWHFSSIWLPL